MTDRDPKDTAATKILLAMKMLDEAASTGRPPETAVVLAHLQSAIEDLLGKKPN